MNENEARELAQEIVSEHKMGCSCGSPDCPQYQCSLAGEDYYPDDWVEQFVSSQCD